MAVADTAKFDIMRQQKNPSVLRRRPYLSATLKGSLYFNFFQQGAGLEGVRRISSASVEIELLLHNAPRVDDERRAVRDELRVIEHAVALADVTAGVRQDVELHAELLRERGVGPRAVHAHAENHGVVRV